MAQAVLLRDDEGLLHIIGGAPEEIDMSAELMKAVAIRRDTTGMVAELDDESGLFTVTITTVEGVFTYTAGPEDEQYRVFHCTRVS
jgi:hypothetical protein